MSPQPNPEPVSSADLLQHEVDAAGSLAPLEIEISEVQVSLKDIPAALAEVFPCK